MNRLLNRNSKAHLNNGNKKKERKEKKNYKPNEKKKNFYVEILFYMKKYIEKERRESRENDYKCVHMRVYDLKRR